MSKKKTVKDRVREYLKQVDNPASTKPSDIARKLKIPPSSARRIAQELFREGFEYSPRVVPRKPERYAPPKLEEERKVDPSKSPLKEPIKEDEAKDYAQAQFDAMQQHLNSVVVACGEEGKEEPSPRIVANADGTIDGEVVFPVKGTSAATDTIERWISGIPYIPMFTFGQWAIRRFPGKKEDESGSDTVIDPSGRRITKRGSFRWQTATSYSANMGTLAKIANQILENGDEKGYGAVYAVVYRVHWNLGQSKPIRER